MNQIIQDWINFDKEMKILISTSLDCSLSQRPFYLSASGKIVIEENDYIYKILSISYYNQQMALMEISKLVGLDKIFLSSENFYIGTSFVITRQKKAKKLYLQIFRIYL